MLMNKGAWWTTVNGVTKNWIWLTDKTTTMPMENTLGTSSVDALRIKNEVQRQCRENASEPGYNLG